MRRILMLQISGQFALAKHKAQFPLINFVILLCVVGRYNAFEFRFLGILRDRGSIVNPIQASLTESSYPTMPSSFSKVEILDSKFNFNSFCDE